MRPGREKSILPAVLLQSRRSFRYPEGDSTNPDFRHAHIYGIDLASPSELIAHERKADIIAKHIGADKVIFQTLEDLETACAEAVSPGGRTRAQQKFEVGVFSGVYVTPVHAGYFEHLEKIRGETRKMKIMESAREAVANGSAGQVEFDIATCGVKVHDGSAVVPASSSDSKGSLAANGHGDKSSNDQKKRDGEGTPSPKERMDISLHNFGDYSG